MRKVMTLVGTRPELIKMSRVIAELDQRVQHVLVHSGQNYDFGLNQVFFDELAIRKPDHFLECGGGSAMQTIADVLARLLLEAKLTVESWSCMSIKGSPSLIVRFRGALPERKSTTCKYKTI